MSPEAAQQVAQVELVQQVALVEPVVVRPVVVRPVVVRPEVVVPQAQVAPVVVRPEVPVEPVPGERVVARPVQVRRWPAERLPEQVHPSARVPRAVLLPEWSTPPERRSPVVRWAAHPSRTLLRTPVRAAPPVSAARVSAAARVLVAARPAAGSFIRQRPMSDLPVRSWMPLRWYRRQQTRRFRRPRSSTVLQQRPRQQQHR